NGVNAIGFGGPRKNYLRRATTLRRATEAIRVEVDVGEFQNVGGQIRVGAGDEFVAVGNAVAVGVGVVGVGTSVGRADIDAGAGFVDVGDAIAIGVEEGIVGAGVVAVAEIRREGRFGAVEADVIEGADEGDVFVEHLDVEGNGLNVRG